MLAPRLARRGVRFHAASVARSLSTRTSWRGGLLGPTHTPYFYATDMDAKEAASLVAEPGLFWSAARADAAAAAGKAVEEVTDAGVREYVHRVEAAARDFLRRDEKPERTALEGALADVVNGEGEFAYVVGGKSMGTSFLLRRLADGQHATPGDGAECPLPRCVLVYDAREHGADLAEGLLLTAVQQLPRTMLQDFFARLNQLAWDTWKDVLTLHRQTILPRFDESELAEWRKDLVEVVRGFLYGISGRRNRGEDVGGGVRSAVPLGAVLDPFQQACEGQQRYPCLVIDHAGAAFPEQGDQERARSARTLAQLAARSKQTLRMNVLLGVDFAEHGRLRAGVLPDHCTSTLVLGDVPPAPMRAMLQQRACVGGGLQLLLHKGEAMSGGCNHIVSLEIPRLITLIQWLGTRRVWWEEESSWEDIADILRAIVERGHVPEWDVTKPGIKLGTELGVWSLALRNCIAPGVPPQEWTAGSRSVSLVIPTSQAMRMRLAVKME